MKLFIVADIHGSLFYVKELLAKFEESKAEHLVILGDILYHGPRNKLPKDYAPAEVAALLNKYKEKIIAVRGNCDAEVDQMLLEFPLLEGQAYIFLDCNKICLTHGHHYNMDNVPNLSKGDYLFFGHTHKSLLEEHQGITFLNPGSISLPKDGKYSYAIMENKKIMILEL